MLELFQRCHQLIPSAKYCLLNSWQGALLHRRHRWPHPHLAAAAATTKAAAQAAASSSPMAAVPPCLESLDMIPPYDKVQLTQANSRLIEWCLAELRRTAHEAETLMRGKIPRGARMKESLNHRDQNGVGTLACSRFLLSLFGMLTAKFSGKQNCFRSVIIFFMEVGTYLLDTC